MRLVVGLTGATGALAAKLLIEKSPWPVALIASDWGRDVYRRECGSFDDLAALAGEVFDDKALSAPVASGSVPTLGMVVLPCSSNTLAKIAGGMGDSLITRAAHCQLKERRRLVLGVRETPWTSIDIDNAAKVDRAGGVIMPLSPPYYMFGNRSPKEITLDMLLGAYVDRVLQLFGAEIETTWETVE